MNPVAWFEIYVHDLERARRFYETVFDLKLTELNTPLDGMKMLSFPTSQEKYGATGALVKMDGAPQGPGGTLVYFSCQDCAVEAARAESAGGKLVRGKLSIAPYGAIAMVTDTEGNLFGLHSMA